MTHNHSWEIRDPELYVKRPLSKPKKIRYVIEYIAAMLLRSLMRIVPFRFKQQLGGWMGLALYYAYQPRRQIAMENIARSFPEKDSQWHRRLCRACFVNMGKSAMEFFSIQVLTPRFIEKFFVVKGEENLVAALAQGRGVIGITPHIGNWEYLGAYFGLKDYPVSVIMKKQKNPYMNRFIEKARESKNLKLIDKHHAGFATLRALKKKRIVGFVADQRARKHGVSVDFFGRPASTVQGPARFATTCGCPVLLFACVRDASGRYLIEISSPLKFDYDNENMEDAIISNTGVWVKAMEEFIRAHPEQYFWVHRRWKASKTARRRKI